MKTTILTIALAVATTAFAGPKSATTSSTMHKGKTHASAMKKHKKHAKKAASSVVSAPAIG